MVNKKGQEIYNLEGTVLRVFPPEHGSTGGKTWIRNKFILKTLEGKDLYITKFGSFDTEYIGKDVRFEATMYNETNYTVQGEIEDAGDLVGAVVVPVATTDSAVANSTASARRRGRPSKQTEAIVSSPTPVGQVSVPVVDNLSPTESLESTARSIVLTNLTRAEALIISMGRKDYTTSDLIAVGDMLGRTYVSLRIEANKDRRMSSFKR